MRSLDPRPFDHCSGHNNIPKHVLSRCQSSVRQLPSHGRGTSRKTQRTLPGILQKQTRLNADSSTLQTKPKGAMTRNSR